MRSDQLPEERPLLQLSSMLIDKLEAVTGDVKEVSTEMRHLKEVVLKDVTELKSRQEQQGKDISSLLSIVRDGNGRDPLTSRVQQLEAKIVSLEKTDAEVAEEKKGRLTAIRTAQISVAVAILGFFLNAMLTLYKDARAHEAPKDDAPYSRPLGGQK